LRGQALLRVGDVANAEADHVVDHRLQALGHNVRLLPPSYVKAYLKRSKNDANDAAAICEAVTRPSMRFVATKSEQQQSGLMLHRSRQLLVCQRTMLSNAIRGHMAELGIISAKGRNGTAELLKIIANEQDDRIPEAARFSLDVLARQYAAVRAEIVAIERRIHAWHRSSEESRRLEEIPGVGPIVATALVAEVGDWKVFSSGRSLAAWIGLVPRQHSTGGKERLGRISKQGNRHLRWLLVAGAMAVIRYARQHGTKRLWLARLIDRGRAGRLTPGGHRLGLDARPAERWRTPRYCRPRQNSGTPYPGSRRDSNAPESCDSSR